MKINMCIYFEANVHVLNVNRLRSLNKCTIIQQNKYINFN